MDINIETKLVGLLGYPLGQSLSPKMQNTAFEIYNLNKIYIPIEVKTENLETVVSGIKKMNFDGFNITKPHKIEIIKYLHEIDDNAKCIGAVNTVTIKNGILKGYNTDGTGFMKSFEENTGEKIYGKNILILGSGGAARAISLTLALNKAKKIFICNRTYEKAVNLAVEINKLAEDCCVAIPMVYEEIEKASKMSDVLINCTSIGMYPNIDVSPIDKGLLNKNLIVCDIVYNPRKTKLIQYAEELGCKTVEGLFMLLYQGVEAFELWTDLKAPADTMLQVIEQGLK